MSRRCALLVTFLWGCADSPVEDKVSWMAPFDDATLVSELSIPGTHESAALYEPVLGSARCQALTIAQQLAAGVRYFDIRCRHMYDAFSIYHGPVDQLQTFDDILATVSEFLDAHPSESVMMSIKEESEPVSATRSFAATFQTYVDRDPDRWRLDDTIPSLGDARGKIVLVRRFPSASTPMGIDAAPWADDTTFTVDNAARLRIQDEYKVSDNAAKWRAITALVDEAQTGDPATLFIDYTSGYKSNNGIPNNLVVADAINPMLDALLRETTGRVGVLAMDHVDFGRVQAVIKTNPPPP